MQNIFSEELKQYRSNINQEIEQYIQKMRLGVDKEEFFLKGAIDNIEEVVLSGGKRIRGALLLTGYSASGGTNEAQVMRAAAGIEFLHSYLLIHDDIMDRDRIRHGVATLNARYQDFALRFFPETDALHFGNSQAIILGDMLCAWGNDCIFGVDLDREDVKRAISKMQEIVYRTGIGQMRDMYFEYRGEASEEEIIEMYRDKTARYTIEGPLHVGALLAGAGEDFLRLLSEYSLPLGVAFQLQDDLLGMYGDEAEIGKKIGADIEEGKITYLIAKARRLLSAEERNTLNKILQKTTELSFEEVQVVRKLVEDCGAKAETKKEIEDSIQLAKTVLEKNKELFDEKTYLFLEGMADYMASRAH
jgi:geranylgeranyl diphosphate synthase, type I